MRQLNEPRARPRLARVLATAAALLCATALGQPNPAYAGPHGGGSHGGGFHGGGFHGGGFHHGFGGFHGGGFHHGFAGFHGNRFHDGRFHAGRFRNRFLFGGLGLGFYGYPYGWDYYPDYGYYGYSQPYSPQTWYYCSDPAGYYPYVAQCNTGWQTVPAS